MHAHAADRDTRVHASGEMATFADRACSNHCRIWLTDFGARARSSSFGSSVAVLPRAVWIHAAWKEWHRCWVYLHHHAPDRARGGGCYLRDRLTWSLLLVARLSIHPLRPPAAVRDQS